MMDLMAGESGQTTSEYAVLFAVVTLAVVATMALLTSAMQGTLQTVIGYL